MFSTPINSSSIRIDESFLLRYINSSNLFQDRVYELHSLDGMNLNFYFVSTANKYLISHVPNDLIDFGIYIKNYLLVSKLMNLPKLMHVDHTKKILIRGFVDGKDLQQDLDTITMAKIAKKVFSLHTSGIKFSNKTSPIELASRMQSSKITDMHNTVGMPDTKHILERVTKAVRIDEELLRPCHNDLNASNFLMVEDDVSIIDWEFSGMNDPAWDVGYFITISRLSDQTADMFVDAYLSLGIADPTFRDRVVVYQPLTLIFIASFFQYRDEKYLEAAKFLFQQAIELYNSSKVQNSLSKLEEITYAPRLSRL